jgi:hypothetical protein
VPDSPNEAQRTAIITTEHFTLQTARSAAITHANGRLVAFLGSVSSSLIALALVGQIGGVGTVFRVFGFLLLVPLALLGIATFERTLQLGIEDIAYARRINTLRRFYFRPGLELDDYLMIPVADHDLSGVIQPGGLVHFHSRWQPFLTNAWVAAIINSFLTGVLVGFVAGAAGANLFTILTLAVVGSVVTGIIHYRHAVGAWREAQAA